MNKHIEVVEPEEMPEGELYYFDTPDDNTGYINKPYDEQPIEYKIYITSKCLEGFPKAHSKVIFSKKIIELMALKIIKDHC